MTCTLHMAWDERLTEYDFGPGHPLAPVRVELTGALVQRTPPTVVGPLSPAEAASKRLAYLGRWGYVSANCELLADPARTQPKKPAAQHETGIKR